MNIENWILLKINSGQEAEVSIALLERQFGDFFFGSRLRQWVKKISDDFGVKATIHFSADRITFYPRTTT